MAEASRVMECVVGEPVGGRLVGIGDFSAPTGPPTLRLVERDFNAEVAEGAEGEVWWLN